MSTSRAAAIVTFVRLLPLYPISVSVRWDADKSLIRGPYYTGKQGDFSDSLCSASLHTLNGGSFVELKVTVWGHSGQK